MFRTVKCIFFLELDTYNCIFRSRAPLIRGSVCLCTTIYFFFLFLSIAVTTDIQLTKNDITSILVSQLTQILILKPSLLSFIYRACFQRDDKGRVWSRQPTLLPHPPFRRRRPYPAGPDRRGDHWRVPDGWWRYTLERVYVLTHPSRQAGSCIQVPVIYY